MKLYKIIVSFLLVGGVAFVVYYKNKENVVQEAPVKKCECGPTEHWFYKSCVKNYNKQFPDANLPEDNDTEGLSGNVVQAIDMLAMDMKFIDENGLPLNLELNTKGDLYLPLFKDSDFKLFKQVLRNVDLATTLPAQELYQQWTAQLNL